MTTTDGDTRFVNLMTPARFGRIELRNRVVMAPMTRSRATPDGAVTDIMVEYYRQRAGAGMIITEGVYPSEAGKGYCRTPGLVSSDHAAGWRRVRRSPPQPQTPSMWAPARPQAGRSEGVARLPDRCRALRAEYRRMA